MEILLKFRVAFITALFAMFGGALKLLLRIDELEYYYMALAPLLALAVSMLISFLLKARWTVKFRNRLKIAAICMLVALLFAVFWYTRLFIHSTFRYKDSNGVAYYVKGTKSSYTQAAIDYKNSHRDITSDAELIRRGFRSPDNKRLAWQEESIDDNILWLITGYCIVIIIFVGAITFFCEIELLKYPKLNKKLAG